MRAISPAAILTYEKAVMRVTAHNGVTDVRSFSRSHIESTSYTFGCTLPHSSQMAWLRSGDVKGCPSSRLAREFSPSLW